MYDQPTIPLPHHGSPPAQHPAPEAPAASQHAPAPHISRTPPVWRFSGWRLLGALVFAASFAGLFIVAVHTALGRRIEDRLLQEAGFYPDSRLLGLISPTALFAACLAVVLIALLRRRLWAAIVAPLILVVSNLAAQLLKHQLLDRPDQLIGAANTFPSGHMVAFCSIVIALLYVLPPVARRWLILPAAALLSVVAVLLFIYGWHRPSDILGGALLVLTVLCAFTMVDQKPQAPQAARSIRGRGLRS